MSERKNPGLTLARAFLDFSHRPDCTLIRVRPLRLWEALLGYHGLAQLPVRGQCDRRLLHHRRSLEQDLIRNLTSALHQRLDASPYLVRDYYCQPIPRSQCALHLRPM